MVSPHIKKTVEVARQVFGVIWPPIKAIYNFVSTLLGYLSKGIEFVFDYLFQFLKFLWDHKEYLLFAALVGAIGVSVYHLDQESLTRLGFGHRIV